MNIGSVAVRATDNPGFMDSKGYKVNQDQLRNTVLNNQKTTFHAVIYCVSIDGKFDMCQQACLQIFSQVYGINAAKYLIIALTKGDMISNDAVVKQTQQKWENELNKVFRSKIPIVVTSKNDVYSVVQLYEKIATIVEERPMAFTPPKLAEPTAKSVCWCGRANNYANEPACQFLCESCNNRCHKGRLQPHGYHECCSHEGSKACILM